MAYSLALLANFAGLILSTWLGVYIVTHSRRSWIALYAGLTLWSLSGLFAIILLFMLVSSAPVSQPLWSRLILPIWPQETPHNIAGWMQGWTASLGIFFWYQTTLLIIPGKMAAWRRWSLYAAYAIGIAAAAAQLFLPHLFQPDRADSLLVDTQKLYSVYPVFATILYLYSGATVLNLIEAKQISSSNIIKSQINPLLVASILANAATLLSILGALPGFAVPIYWVSSILVAAVAFFGFGVTRYSALLGHRILRRDLAYSASATGLVVLVYLSAFLWLRASYQLPQGTVVYLIPLVILSHSLAEEVRLVLERLIYDRKTSRLRNTLKELKNLAGEQADLGNMLGRSLEAICYPVRATFGVVLIFDQENAHLVGTFRWHDHLGSLPRKAFEAEDVRQFEHGGLPAPFQEAALLLPLFASMQQIGALLLGRPENGVLYSREDIQLLQKPGEQISELIIRSRRINVFMDLFDQLPVQPGSTATELIPIEWVEDALQNLYDYAYLGDSPLANLKQVKTRLRGGASTHLDKGKTVNQVVSDAIEKLRPGAALPGKAVSREWHPYLILHDAYYDGLHNREIMQKLYISEGTFHRTRRSAIRSMARVLSELELS